MIYLKWVNGGWRYADGIVTARFASGAVVDIPVGKSRFGAFYITRLGEHEWRIAPIRFPKNRPESFDDEGHYNDFIHLSGGPMEIHRDLELV